MVAAFIEKKVEQKAARVEQKEREKQLEQDLNDCLLGMRKNEMLFNLEIDHDLVEQRIYERQALQCRYRYLIEKARKMGLRVKGLL